MSRRISIDIADTWMIPIITYLEQGVLPPDRNEGKKMMRRASRYLVMEGILYRRGYSMPLLRCVTPNQSKNLLAEVHEGLCSDHDGGRAYQRRFWDKGFFGQQWLRIPWNMWSGAINASSFPKYREHHLTFWSRCRVPDHSQSGVLIWSGNYRKGEEEYSLQW